jgi:acetyl esterase/lipase
VRWKRGNSGARPHLQGPGPRRLKMRALPRLLLMLSLPALAALLGGCTVHSMVNAFVPTSDLEIRRDVAYGEGARGQLDVYRRRDTPPGAPVVVFFYGGGWDSGDRASYLFAAEGLASRGYVAVVPDYRIYPAVRFPVFLDDAAAAVAWTKRHVREFGGNPDKIFVMGHSAGAHVAAMIALDAQYLGRVGLSQRDLAGFIGLAGPYDFLPLKSETLKQIFAPEDTIARTQPINFATASAPPVLLATGDQDTVVSPQNTRSLARKLRDLKVDVTEVHYPECSHATILGMLAAPVRSGTPLLDDVDRFVRAH